jgi:predicted DsbA family dithiol-disulfide isomerase
MTEPVEIDFYSDPACGWAWRTSLWIRLVAKHRPIKVNWRVFSLGVVNFPEDWKTDTTVSHLRGARMLRTLIMANRVGGNEAVDRLSIAYGNAMHGHGSKDDMSNREVHLRCLQEAGLPTSLFDDAQADESTESEMVATTRKAIDELGVFGVPTLALPGSKVAIFGPVIHPVPLGEEALALWDGVLTALKQPALYEMKRTRVKYDRPQIATAEGLPVEALQPVS